MIIEGKEGEPLVVLSKLSGEDYISEHLLAGKDGDLIKVLLKDAGLDYTNFSFANCESIYLRGLINDARPACIIAMGNEAMKELTKKSGMKNHRGKILNLHPSFNYLCSVYPTYSVEDLKNVPTFRKTIVADLRNTQQGEPETVEFEYWSNDGEDLLIGQPKLGSQV